MGTYLNGCIFGSKVEIQFWSRNGICGLIQKVFIPDNAVGRECIKIMHNLVYLP